jgi:hypothetical protein
MITRRSLFFWLAWLLLLWAPLQTLPWAAFWGTAVRESADLLPGWEQTSGSAQHEVFKEPSSASQEFNAQSERQSKKVRILIRRPETRHQDQAQARRWLSPALLTPRPVRLFFPRKLSPPTAAEVPPLI